MKPAKRFWIFVGAVIIGLLIIGYLKKTGGDMALFISRRGYTLTYPKSWIVDASEKEAPAEFIREPGGRAMVAVQTMEDARLKNPAERSVVLKEAADAFKQSKDYIVDSLEWEAEDAFQDESTSYMATGSFILNGEKWRFREIAVFNASSIIFFLRANAKAEFAKEFGPVVDKIIFSFKPIPKPT